MNKILVVYILLLSVSYAKVIPNFESKDTSGWVIPEKILPLPSCASQEVQKVLSKIKKMNVESRRKFVSKSKEEWKDLVTYSKESGAESTKIWADKYKVSIKKEMIDGVNIYYVTPNNMSFKKSKKLFIYLHGGAYIFGGGESGLNEAILIASRVHVPVISIDYRMPPDYPYPHGLNDVVHVYKTLLKLYPFKSIVMGGSSSGGGLALSTVHKLKALHLPTPQALFIGTPWSDLTKTGDSLYVNEGVDRKIVTYDGFLPAAVKLYANGEDLKNPGLSPVYGDFTGFPPTMLVTGTRDLFLSLTVRVHRKMKEAGVIADLNVYEGLSHVEYFVVPDAPESKEVYRELKKFLEQYM